VNPILDFKQQQQQQTVHEKCSPRLFFVDPRFTMDDRNNTIKSIEQETSDFDQ